MQALHPQIKASIDDMADAFDEFKAKNDKRYDAMGRRLDDFDKVMARPGFGGLREPGASDADREAFGTFLRTGQQAAMQESDDVKGGYLVAVGRKN